MPLIVPFVLIELVPDRTRDFSHKVSKMGFPMVSQNVPGSHQEKSLSNGVEAEVDDGLAGTRFFECFVVLEERVASSAAGRAERRSSYLDVVLPAGVHLLSVGVHFLVGV